LHCLFASVAHGFNKHNTLTTAFLLGTRFSHFMPTKPYLTNQITKLKDPKDKLKCIAKQVLSSARILL